MSEMIVKVDLHENITMLQEHAGTRGDITDETYLKIKKKIAFT